MSEVVIFRHKHHSLQLADAMIRGKGHKKAVWLESLEREFTERRNKGKRA